MSSVSRMSVDSFEFVLILPRLGVVIFPPKSTELNYIHKICNKMKICDKQIHICKALEISLGRLTRLNLF